jgi:phospholipid/cholesterol/gamma-HCH transport system permease protein
MSRKPVIKKAAADQENLYRLEDQTLHLTHRLYLPDVPGFNRSILKDIKSAGLKNLVVNLEKLQDIDSAGVVSLYYLRNKLAQTGIAVRFEGGHAGISEKMELFRPEKFAPPAVIPRMGFLENIGSHAYDFFATYVYEFLILAANVFNFTITELFRPGTRRKGEVINQAVLIGANAVLIVAFMSFVIGLVLALQTAQQLRSFGANIFIVDLTVVAMMSQMGPLITAILVAGRSGSAIAAEIATMKVTSELDALQTMGLNPIKFVVIPKLYASLLTIPFLIVLANVAGIAGGATAAYFYLDITPEVFINRMGGVMQNKDLFTGFVKSQVYACLIVLTGSFYGFRVDRGAEGVGKATTASVVVAISLVIIADSILGLLFY